MADDYFKAMLSRGVRTDGFIDPCIPTLAAKPPSGPDWVHEIKHDGYRLIVRRDGKAVRLFTRRGYDWTDRYPTIASAAGKLRAKSFTIDGEAVGANHEHQSELRDWYARAVRCRDGGGRAGDGPADHRHTGFAQRHDHYQR